MSPSHAPAPRHKRYSLVPASLLLRQASPCSTATPQILRLRGQSCVSLHLADSNRCRRAPLFRYASHRRYGKQHLRYVGCAHYPRPPPTAVCPPLYTPLCSFDPFRPWSVFSYRKGQVNVQDPCVFVYIDDKIFVKGQHASVFEFRKNIHRAVIYSHDLS